MRPLLSYAFQFYHFLLSFQGCLRNLSEFSNTNQSRKEVGVTSYVHKHNFFRFISDLEVLIKQIPIIQIGFSEDSESSDMSI